MFQKIGKKLFLIAAIGMMASLIMSFFKKKKNYAKMANICFFSNIDLVSARKKIFKIFFLFLKVKITYKLNIYRSIC